MIRIKIVRRFAREPNAKGMKPIVYDVYFDVGFFSPLIKKWKMDESGLTKEELMKYMTIWLADTSNNKIYVEAEY